MSWFISPLRKPLTEEEIRRIWRGLDLKKSKAEHSTELE